MFREPQAEQELASTEGTRTGSRLPSLEARAGEGGKEGQGQNGGALLSGCSVDRLQGQDQEPEANEEAHDSGRAGMWVARPSWWPRQHGRRKGGRHGGDPHLSPNGLAPSICSCQGTHAPPWPLSSPACRVTSFCNPYFPGTSGKSLRGPGLPPGASASPPSQGLRCSLGCSTNQSRGGPAAQTSLSLWVSDSWTCVRGTLRQGHSAAQTGN